MTIELWDVKTLGPCHFCGGKSVWKIYSKQVGDNFLCDSWDCNKKWDSEPHSEKESEIYLGGSGVQHDEEFAKDLEYLHRYDREPRKVEVEFK